MKQILCFGDSNTWGLIPKTNQRYPWGVRWTSILDNELNRHFNNEYRDGVGLRRFSVFLVEARSS